MLNQFLDNHVLLGWGGGGVIFCLVGWLVLVASKYINVGILVKTTCIHPLQYTFRSHPDLDFLAFIIYIYSCIYFIYIYMGYLHGQQKTKMKKINLRYKVIKK